MTNIKQILSALSSCMKERKEPKGKVEILCKHHGWNFGHIKWKIL